MTPALRRQRQESHCKLKASLVYIMSYQDSSSQKTNLSKNTFKSPCTEQIYAMPDFAVFYLQGYTG